MPHRRVSRLFAMPVSTLLYSLCLLMVPCSASARSDGSSHYIALDVYSGTPASPCTNSLDGWAPSIDALKDPRSCYGTDDDHVITCISRRMDRTNEDEKMLSTAQMDCKVNGYTNDKCSGSTYWPAEYFANNQTWTWTWDQSSGTVNVSSFGIACQ